MLVQLCCSGYFGNDACCAEYSASWDSESLSSQTEDQMEISYAEVSHEAKAPKPGLEPLAVTAGLHDTEPAEAEDEVDNSSVGGELPAIVVADIVEGEHADAAAAAACVVVQE